jgi:hypothetical protein
MTPEELEKFIRDKWAERHPGDELSDELFMMLLELLEKYARARKEKK